jgi:hypothetical protein
MNGLKLKHACRCGEEATYFIGDRHLCARCLAVLLDINVEEDMAGRHGVRRKGLIWTANYSQLGNWKLPIELPHIDSSDTQRAELEIE